MVSLLASRYFLESQLVTASGKVFPATSFRISAMSNRRCVFTGVCFHNIGCFSYSSICERKRKLIKEEYLMSILG